MNRSRHHSPIPALLLLAVFASTPVVADGTALIDGEAPPALHGSHRSAPLAGPPPTLIDEDFTPLDIFRNIKRLRPRVSATQGATIGQDFGSTEIDRFTSAFQTSILAPLTTDFAIRLVGEMNAKFFDFHRGGSFMPALGADPFEELLSSTFRLEGRYQLNETWAVVGGAELSSDWEAGSRFDKGMRQRGSIGLARLFRERFSVLAGVRLSSRLARGGVKPWPIVQLGWRVTDDIEIQTLGLGGRVAGRISQKLTLYLQGGLRSSSHRLDERGGAVGRGVLKTDRIPIVAGARFKITRRWRIRAFAGAVLSEKYTLYDGDHKKLDTNSSHRPAFTGDFSVAYRF